MVAVHATCACAGIAITHLHLPTSENASTNAEAWQSPGLTPQIRSENDGSGSTSSEDIAVAI